MDRARPAVVPARGLVIAAPASGAGKTLVTLGLLRALARAGRRVSSAKVGPDYIDPRYHAAASGHPCVTLDCWAMRQDLVTDLAAGLGDGTEVALIEGVMGLFDGTDAGEGSTADLAALLGLPVLLVVDARAQAQSAAALVKGFAEYRPSCRISGVIFNQVGSDRHEAVLRAAVEPLGIPVVGALRLDRAVQVPSRHLGLVQAAEHVGLEGFIDTAAGLVERSVDLELLQRIAVSLPQRGSTAAAALAPLGQRVAVAYDEAFGFSYPHMLDCWRRAGAEVMPFSPLADEAPDPRADSVYLPGGYPELHAGRLAANRGFLDGLARAAANDSVIYGECGGYMVLGEELIDAEGEVHAMAGLLPVATSFAKRKLHLGYRRLKHSQALPWPAQLRGHEFHYSTLVRQGAGEALFEAADSAGRQLGSMGLRHGRVMGSYAHVIDGEAA